MKTLIKNGLIVDGTGKKAYRGDLLIQGDRIVRLGVAIEALDTQLADTRVIDATGQVVCPGFIDTHCHSELTLLTNPLMEHKLSQGITTEILGQDGLSVAPVSTEDRELWANHVAGLTGELERQWWWDSILSYFRAVEAAGPTTNMMYLAPHGNLKMMANGLKAVPASENEIALMRELLAKAIEDGCCGMSTGLIYPPCCYADRRELIGLCTELAERGKPFVLHQRSEAADILASTREVIELGRATGVKIHFSHMKLAGKNNWHLLEPLVSLFDKAEAEGVDISFDQYPYTAGSTTLAVLLPPWVHDGGTEKAIQKLKEQQAREKIKADVEMGLLGWDNFVEIAGYDGIYITETVKNREVIGLNLVQLGEKFNCDPLNAAMDLLLEEELKVGMVDFYGNEESLVTFMKDRRQNFCSDGLLENTPHPRVYGAFPRVFRKYVKEDKVLSLEEAVRKMTSVPADRFGIVARGRLAEGNFADIVIFDPQTIADRATYEDPCQLSSGINYVFVNGKAVWEKGQPTGTGSGKILR